MAEWISVKDRISEYNKRVLVSHRSGVTIAYHNGFGWVTIQNKNHYLSSVTYWMPLPERPKESDNK